MASNMENRLKFICKEIEEMIGIGGVINTDKVIYDATGIPAVATQLIASSNKIALAYRYSISRNGNAFELFFDPSMHQIRMELVRLLAKAMNMIQLGKRAKQSEYEAIMDWYAKAMKKVCKIIGSPYKKKNGTIAEFPALLAMMEKKKPKPSPCSEYDVPEYDDEDIEEEEEEYEEPVKKPKPEYTICEVGGQKVKLRDDVEEQLEKLRNGEAKPESDLTPDMSSLSKSEFKAWVYERLEQTYEELFEALAEHIGRPLTDEDKDKFLDFINQDDEDDKDEPEEDDSEDEIIINSDAPVEESAPSADAE